MKSLIKFILPLLVLTSCNPAKYCAEKFPSTIDTVRISKFDTVISYIDTTIFITLPVDTFLVIKDSIIWMVDEATGVLYSDTISAESNLAEARSWIISERQYLQVWDKDTTLIIQLDSAIVKRNYWKAEYIRISEKQVIPVRKKTKWYWFGLSILLGIAIGLFIKK